MLFWYGWGLTGWVVSDWMSDFPTHPMIFSFMDGYLQMITALPLPSIIHLLTCKNSSTPLQYSLAYWGTPKRLHTVAIFLQYTTTWHTTVLVPQIHYGSTYSILLHTQKIYCWQMGWPTPIKVQYCNLQTGLCNPTNQKRPDHIHNICSSMGLLYVALFVEGPIIRDNTIK